MAEDEDESEAEDLGGRAKMRTYEDAPGRVKMIRRLACACRTTRRGSG